MRTILLKTEEDTNYYITSLNEEQYNQILKHNKENSLDILSITMGINLTNVAVIGSLDGKSVLHISSNLRRFIDFFEANTSGERQKHYRDYSKSKEKQKDMAWLINIAPDYKSSWITLNMALNNPTHCIIWLDDKDKKYENVRPF